MDEKLVDGHSSRTVEMGRCDESVTETNLVTVATLEFQDGGNIDVSGGGCEELQVLVDRVELVSQKSVTQS
jgi:hypothetical protein